MTDFNAKIKPTESEAEGMHHVYEVLAAGARSVQEGFTQPEDDWAQIWLVATPAGEAHFVVSEMHKDITTTTIGDMARKAGAHVVGFIGSAWSIDTANVPEAERPAIMFQAQTTPLEHMPYRVEQVVISIYTASQVQLHTADIMRFDNSPPVLGEFREVPAEGEITGGMVEPVQSGLRRMG